MDHFGYGLGPFVKDLQQAMTNRINEFAKHMRDEMVRNGDTAQSKTKRQWMYEYKKWLLGDEDELQKEILRYLIITESDSKIEIGNKNEGNSNQSKTKI